MTVSLPADLFFIGGIFLVGTGLFLWAEWRAKRDGAAIDAMMAERRAKKRRGA